MSLDILDCTLRDGGYYCSWDFDDSMVVRYLRAIADAGVKYVEIGFRTKAAQGFAGKYRFCSEHTLRRLLNNRSVRLAVMIDGKDFIHPESGVDTGGIRALFRPKSDSLLDMVRVATTLMTLQHALEIGEELKELGYEVSINVMQASMLSEEELSRLAIALDRSSADILYLADSFGGLTPEATRKGLAIIKQHFSRRAGFHAHDNLGLALANSLAAVEGGAEMVDCSLLGMGRGAGNLRTEQFLIYLCSKAGRKDLDPSPLFDVVLSDFAKLQQQYQWGSSLPYMLAGVHNVHPMYPQQLLQAYRYAPLEVVRILERLHASGEGASFSAQRLATALQERFTGIKDRVLVASLPSYQPDCLTLEEEKTRPILLLGSGPSVHARAEDINEFIRLHQPLVVECNLQAGIETGPDQFSLFTNYRRLEEHINDLRQKRRRVVLGMPEVSARVARLLEGSVVHHYTYRVGDGQFEVAPNGCVIPHDVVAMFAFAFAIRIGATSIFLCGFDGYLADGSRGSAQLNERIAMEREMEGFFRLLKQHEAVRRGVRVVSLTPTSYGVQQDSLYAYI